MSTRETRLFSPKLLQKGSERLGGGGQEASICVLQRTVHFRRTFPTYSYMQKRLELGRARVKELSSHLPSLRAPKGQHQCWFCLACLATSCNLLGCKGQHKVFCTGQLRMEKKGESSTEKPVYRMATSWPSGS